MNSSTCTFPNHIRNSIMVQWDHCLLSVHLLPCWNWMRALWIKRDIFPWFHICIIFTVINPTSIHINAKITKTSMLPCFNGKYVTISLLRTECNSLVPGMVSQFHGMDLLTSPTATSQKYLHGIQIVIYIYIYIYSYLKCKFVLFWKWYWFI